MGQIQKEEEQPKQTPLEELKKEKSNYEKLIEEIDEVSKLTKLLETSNIFKTEEDSYQNFIIIQKIEIEENGKYIKSKLRIAGIGNDNDVDLTETLSFQPEDSKNYWHSDFSQHYKRISAIVDIFTKHKEILDQAKEMVVKLKTEKKE